MTTYLFAWNPKRWSWDNIDDESKEAKSGHPVMEPWSTANKNPQIGDRAFLFKFGDEPKGIIALGTIVSEPYSDLHWDPEKAKAGQKIYYVDIEWETLLNPDRDKILRRERLDMAPVPKFHWDTQSSGVVIPKDVAEALEQLWAAATNNKPNLVGQIIEALTALGGVAQYSNLYDYMEAHAALPLPRTWKASVRAQIEERSSDSEAFQGKDDLFYSAEGLGNGVWGLQSMLRPTPPAADTKQPNNPAKRARIEEYRIIRDTKITKQLKSLYNNRCQICGNSLALGETTYSEAHHIRPLGDPHNGPDIAANIIVVCPNHHAQFDYGALAIDPVSMKIRSTNPGDKLHQKALLVHPKHALAPEYLEYHLNSIFIGAPER